MFILFDKLAARYEVNKIKTIGDCYVAGTGILKSMPDHATAMVDMALAMQAAMEVCFAPAVEAQKHADGRVCCWNKRMASMLGPWVVMPEKNEAASQISPGPVLLPSRTYARFNQADH